MRTTIDIPDPLYRQLKARAAGAGTSVKALILAGVQREMNGKESHRKNRVRLPIIGSTRPETLKIDNERIFEIIPFP